MSYNKTTMKFEKQRIAGPLANKIELTNQEFLTFRNNPPSQNTGRSIYSQPFDYRSLEKYSPEDPLEPAKYNFKKPLRNIRSQDKYKQIHQEALSLVTDQNGQSTFSTEKEKNEELKARIALISKSIRRAQKKSDALDDQIAHYSQLVEENNEEIQRSKSGVDQLSEIAQQNIVHCNSMMSRIRGLEERAKELSQRCGIIDRELQGEIATARSKDRDNPQMHMKLQQGMKQLEKMGDALDSKIALFEQEIQRMQIRLEELAKIDQNVRSVGCV